MLIVSFGKNCLLSAFFFMNLVYDLAFGMIGLYEVRVGEGYGSGKFDFLGVDFINLAYRALDGLFIFVGDLSGLKSLYSFFSIYYKFAPFLKDSWFFTSALVY